MKKIISVLLTSVFLLTGFAQTDNEVIKVADDIELIKLSDNAYIHVSYTNYPNIGRTGANGLILIDENQAFLFDSPWTDLQTEKLFSWVQDSLGVNIVGFVPNHWHVDCMGGLGYIKKQNVKSYANQMTIDIAKSEGLPVPEYGFKDSLELKLGDKLIECYYLGAAHSLDNIVVWIPSEKILFPGCMVKRVGAKNLGFTADGDLAAYPHTLTKLIELFPLAEIVIPGHGKYGGIELIKYTLELATK